MMAAVQRVQLLDGGSLVIDHSQLMWNVDPGHPVRVPVYSTLIRHPDATLVFDTSFNLALAQEHLPHEHPEQAHNQTLPPQLAACGVTAADVDIVINSHVHFDHVGGNGLFPHATLVLGEAEYHQAHHPALFETAAYLDQDFDKVAQIRAITGDVELLPGVHLIATPGHTVGHYSLLLEFDGRRPMLFTGDATYTAASLERMAITGFHNDPNQCVVSMERIKAIAADTGAEIFYPHDPELWPRYRHGPNGYE